MKKNKEQIIKESVEGMLKMFETGTMPEKVAFSIIRKHKKDVVPAMKWSLGNQMLMLLGGTADARGFKQWQQAGRKVKKGAKAIYIMGPLSKKITEIKNGKEEEKIIIYGFRPIPVFRYEDTEGDAVPKFDYRPDEIPRFYDVAGKIGVKVEYDGITRNALGSYCSRNKKITLYSKDDAVYYHELAHAADDYLHDTSKDGKDKEAYAKSEIVAELASSVLCHMKGIKGYEKQAYEYMSRYAKQIKTNDGVMKEMMKLLGRVEGVVSLVLTKADEPELEKAI